MIKPSSPFNCEFCPPTQSLCNHSSKKPPNLSNTNSQKEQTKIKQFEKHKIQSQTNTLSNKLHPDKSNANKKKDKIQDLNKNQSVTITEDFDLSQSCDLSSEYKSKSMIK